MLFVIQGQDSFPYLNTRGKNPTGIPMDMIKTGQLRHVFIHSILSSAFITCLPLLIYQIGYLKCLVLNFNVK